MKNIKISQERGATLVESLVSLVILAIAVIGMLGVQVRTLMDTNTAAGRTQAISLINDLAERIRANPGSFEILENYEFDQSHANSGINCTSNCNKEDLAAYDIDQWLENFKSTMPTGKVTTFLSDDNNRQLGVLIQWTMREKNSDANSDYVKNFSIPTNNTNDGVLCEEGFICHLAYIGP